MKRFLTISALSAAMIVAVSCQKDNPGQDSKIPAQTQLATYDQTGYEALSQIDPNDFQKLADIVKTVSGIDFENIQYDPSAQLAIQNIVAQMTVQQGQTTYYVVNTDLVSGTFIITIAQTGATLSYTAGEGKHVVVKDGSKTHSLDLDFAKTNKLLRISSSKEAYKTVLPEDGDVFCYAPSAIKIDLNYNNELYARIDLNTDFSQMPEDLVDLQISDVNFSMNGEICINGLSSYKVRFDKFSLSNSTITTSFGINGKSNTSIVKGSAQLLCLDNDKASAEVNYPTFIPVALDLNVRDKVYVKSAGSNLNFYINPYSNVQMSVDISTGVATFCDGTVEEEVFVEENFPKTVTAFGTLAEAFRKMFSFE